MVWPWHVTEKDILKVSGTMFKAWMIGLVKITVPVRISDPRFSSDSWSMIRDSGSKLTNPVNGRFGTFGPSVLNLYQMVRSGQYLTENWLIIRSDRTTVRLSTVKSYPLCSSSDSSIRYFSTSSSVKRLNLENILPSSEAHRALRSGQKWPMSEVVEVKDFDWKWLLWSLEKVIRQFSAVSAIFELQSTNSDFLLFRNLLCILYRDQIFSVILGQWHIQAFCEGHRWFRNGMTHVFLSKMIWI